MIHIVNIFFILCLLKITFVVGSREDHWNEDPAYKYMAGSNNKTLEDAEPATKDQMKNLAVKFHLMGIDALSAKHYKRALHLFTESYKCLPLNPQNLALRASCHMKMEKTGAENPFQILDSHVVSASLAYLDAQEALYLDPENEIAQNAKIEAMVSLNRRPEEKKLTKGQFTEQVGNTVEWPEQDGETLSREEILEEADDNFENKDYETAVGLYNLAMPRLSYGSESHIGALRKRAAALKFLDRHLDAYCDIVEALDFDLRESQKYDFRALKGVVLLELGRYEAIADFEKASAYDPSDEWAITKFQELISRSRKYFAYQRSLLLDNFEKAKGNIAEITMGPTSEFESIYKSSITHRVNFEDGTSAEFKEVDDLLELLTLYHFVRAEHSSEPPSRISRVTFSAIILDNFVPMFFGIGGVLPTDILTMEQCVFSFSKLSDDEFLDMIRNIFRPQLLTLGKSVGLSNERLNKWISLLECKLMILGEDEDLHQLDPNGLIDFLHKGRDGDQEAYLTIQSEYIDGGVEDFVEKIIKRFKSDIRPVKFMVNLTEDDDLPIMEENPLENANTGESKKELKMVFKLPYVNTLVWLAVFGLMSVNSKIATKEQTIWVTGKLYEFDGDSSHRLTQTLTNVNSTFVMEGKTTSVQPVEMYVKVLAKCEYPLFRRHFFSYLTKRCSFEVIKTLNEDTAIPYDVVVQYPDSYPNASQAHLRHYVSFVIDVNKAKIVCN
ncbi:hypothetical protein Ddc_14666 [Ditylenchus destructor]|nr:hypothetical protein Ddc_14666 [Ditylenchus destructor]